eukprot:gene8738-11808_t
MEKMNQAGISGIQNDASDEDDSIIDDFDMFGDFDTSTPVTSLKKSNFTSQEMKKLVSLSDPDDISHISTELANFTYKSSTIFPDSILSSNVWKSSKAQSGTLSDIGEIFKINHFRRNPEQTATAIKWLMSVWKIADEMGIKKCASMLKQFQYEVFEPGQSIIIEGDRGLTMYIILSGQTSVHKKGIGIVAQLGDGKSFGEIALTQGKDLRTATITAITTTQVLKLAKEDFDYFVRDIHEIERRENFHAFTACKLFANWTRSKIDLMLNSCSRKLYEKDDVIFRQGDPPDNLYIIFEGSVDILKEVIFVGKNRWPSQTHKWTERSVKQHKPVVLRTLNKGEFFGEVAIIKNILRTTTAVAKQKSIIIVLDKLEFLHLINPALDLSFGMPVNESTVKKAAEIADTYIGGPSSVVLVGEILIKPPPSKNALKYQPKTRNTRYFNHEFYGDGNMNRSEMPVTPTANNKKNNPGSESTRRSLSPSSKISSSVSLSSKGNSSYYGKESSNS